MQKALLHGAALPEVAAVVARRRALIEVRLVGAILSDPLWGLAAAEQAGVAAELFEQEDLQTIFLAVVVKQRLGALGRGKLRDQVGVLRLAARALWLDRMWDANGAIGSGPLWNNESLASLATREPCRAQVPTYSRQLIDMRRRLRDAEEHLHYARLRLLGALQ